MRESKLPNRMKQARLVDIEKVQVEETDVPAVSGSDVLVEVQRCGICGSDLHMYYGESPLKPPLIQGHEFSGVVVDAGSDADPFSVGDRVVIEPGIPAGDSPLCDEEHYNVCPSLEVLGAQRPGGLSQYVVVPKRALLKLPQELSFEEGALVEPFSFAVHVNERGGTNSATRMVILGGGTVGLSVLQVAKAMDAGFVAVSEPSKFKRTLAGRLGASRTLDPRSATVEAELLQRDNAGGFDVIYDCVCNQQSMNQALALVRPQGRIVLVGISMESISFEPLRVLTREIDIIGVNMYRRKHFDEALRLATAGKLDMRSMISATFPISEVPEAYKTLEENGPNLVKVLIDPTQG